MLSWCYVMNRAMDMRISHGTVYFIKTDSVKHRSRTECLHTPTFERGGVGCRLGGVSRRARRLIKILYHVHVHS